MKFRRFILIFSCSSEISRISILVNDNPVIQMLIWKFTNRFPFFSFGDSVRHFESLINPGNVIHKIFSCYFMQLSNCFFTPSFIRNYRFKSSVFGRIRINLVKCLLDKYTEFLLHFILSFFFKEFSENL